MSKSKRVVLSYTEREWLKIEYTILKSGNKNGIISHIIKEVKKLDTDCVDINEDNKIHLTTTKKRQFYPPQNSIEILNNLSEKLKIPASTIVSRLIINPLLK